MNKNQSTVYYSKTDLLYNLAKIEGDHFELHLNCPHINKPQIITVHKDEIDMVEDVNDPFNPEDYGFKPDNIMEGTEGTWVEDWLKINEETGVKFHIYRNGFLFFHVYYTHKYISSREQSSIFFGRIPSKTDGDIIMKNLGFKRVK